VIGGRAEDALRRLAAAAGLLNRRVWRVGHVGAPLQFVPLEFCSWQHRFDDPRQQYRTLYCAEHPVTCLREVLADLRPNAKARADFEAFQHAQGLPETEIHRPAGEVRLAWRQQHVLAPATVRRNGPLADLDDPALRERLADSHAALLVQHGLDYLNIAEIRSKTRIVTQTIGRDLYERGAAGLLFRSNLDDHRCIVLFEGRAELQPDGNPTPLTEDVPELLTVCGEYGLILQGTPAPAPPERAWRP
jgi:hypothetical protein